MEQVIRLLPDNIANQIAAGEVVQRPASVVKELLENAIDAGATRIDLVIKDAGKALVQVIDNGSGMSAHDARMCFERHATSKIRQTEDLFNIRTMGFRGEAMASIAAVAQVHMQTRLEQAELGTEVVIEGNEIRRQGPIMTAKGTMISVKNLFFNVPARRNFLKSNPVETRHVLNEFIRVALPHPEIGFTFEHNGHQVYDLPPASLQGRILQLFGKDLDGHLIDLNESTPYVAIGGYVGSPDAAKHKKGEQYFFVNRRYIRSPYLHHAISTAFDGLLPTDSQPYYFVFFDIEPGHIDINIHPTKTEIKFDDERTVYALLHSVIRKSLGEYHRSPVVPPLPEENEADVTIRELIRRSPLPRPDLDVTLRQVREKNSHSSSPWDDFFGNSTQSVGNAQAYAPYEPKPIEPHALPIQPPKPHLLQDDEFDQGPGLLAQIESRYILHQGSRGLLLIDQQAAHQRILFEHFLHASPKHPLASQQLLFPMTLNLSPMDFSFLKEIEHDLRFMGFDLKDCDGNMYQLHGLPAILKGSKAEQLFESILKDIQQEGESDAKNKLFTLLARSISMRSAIQPGKRLTREEMRNITEQLFACQEPGYSPTGRPTYFLIDLKAVDRHFQSNA